ncbi:hypothetical protein E8E13_009186 [Curvularia kusanoi]|uniref:BTB domain-containing protein n=1 Tax=Curvularia kusanoi TaxID=90978 RepID=A0A9P4WCM9_CURKU|nr:hypothetical protein E8E13_009186 [Curvularia kusanoi]
MAYPSAPDHRSLQSSQYDFVESTCILVKVGTGPALKEFSVHESLIIARSVFIGRALQSEVIITPPNIEPEVFSLYLKFLYTGCLPITPQSTQGSGESERSEEDSEDFWEEESNDGGGDVQDQYLALSKLFVLAEQLMDERAKEAVLGSLHARCEELNYAVLPNYKSVCTIYYGTHLGTGARKWLTDFELKYPPDFIADVAECVLEKRVQPWVHEKLQGELEEYKEKVERLTEELHSK